MANVTEGWSVPEWKQLHFYRLRNFQPVLYCHEKRRKEHSVYTCRGPGCNRKGYFPATFAPEYRPVGSSLIPEIPNSLPHHSPRFPA